MKYTARCLRYTHDYPCELLQLVHVNFPFSLKTGVLDLTLAFYYNQKKTVVGNPTPEAFMEEYFFDPVSMSSVSWNWAGGFQNNDGMP